MTDREKLIALLYNADDRAYWDTSNVEFLAKIADFLIANGVTCAADTEEAVKRGHWIIRTSGIGRYATNWAECSECHIAGSPQWKRCPVCEAKMELEV